MLTAGDVSLFCTGKEEERKTKPKCTQDYKSHSPLFMEIADNLRAEVEFLWCWGWWEWLQCSVRTAGRISCPGKTDPADSNVCSSQLWAVTHRLQNWASLQQKAECLHPTLHTSRLQLSCMCKNEPPQAKGAEKLKLTSMICHLCFEMLHHSCTVVWGALLLLKVYFSVPYTENRLDLGSQRSAIMF